MGREKELSKRQRRRQQMRQVETRRRILTLGLVTVGALLVAFVLIYPNLKPVGAIATADPFERPQAPPSGTPQANSAGDPNAPIKIEEFSDFQCPACLAFYQQYERQLLDTYVASGQVYFVYRSMGLFIGPESVSAAEAAYCAGDQEKFWEMHDIIFANQTGENVGAFNDRRLQSFAETIGLDMGEFNSCFNGGKYSDRVQQDFEDGRAAGVDATPSFLMTYTVNGEARTKVIRGALPIDDPNQDTDFKREIEAALAEMGQ